MKAEFSIKKLKIEATYCQCERCGYRWISETTPLRCAKCKTPYWNIAKEEK